MKKEIQELERAIPVKKKAWLDAVDIENKLQEKISSYESLQAKLKSAEVNLAKNEANIAAKESQITSKNSEQQDKNRELNRLSQDVERERDRVKDYENEIDRANRELNWAYDKLSDAERDYDNSQIDLSSAYSYFNSLTYKLALDFQDLKRQLTYDDFYVDIYDENGDGVLDNKWKESLLLKFRKSSEDIDKNESVTVNVEASVFDRDGRENSRLSRRSDVFRVSAFDEGIEVDLMSTLFDHLEFDNGAHFVLEISVRNSNFSQQRVTLVGQFDYDQPIESNNHRGFRRDKHNKFKDRDDRRRSKDKDRRPDRRRHEHYLNDEPLSFKVWNTSQY
ncbi:MAG: hypothetical protein KDD40_06785 [Bdellovibrionales bacterium]|nr:hypothetical protein [Bdellovibrionales bacterium]